MMKWIPGVILLGLSAFAVVSGLRAVLEWDRQAELEFDQWRAWRSAHCHIISVSAGGWGSSDMVAVRCDDNREYIQVGRRTPGDWSPR